MNRKAVKTNKSAPTVIKPSKISATTDSEQLIIPSRSILQEGAPGSEPHSDAARLEPASAPPLQPPKRTVIVPRDENEIRDVPAPDTPKVSAPNSASSKMSKHIDIKPFKTEEAPAAEPAPTAAAAPAAPTSTPSSEPEESNSTPAVSDKPESIADDTSPDKPSPETRQAIEEATKAEKRERELQDYINSHQFFVPINTVARKRSLKVSIGLTILFFFLGVVLIDLMLDSGMILLVQKIPHTHFFSLNAPNN